MKDAIILIFANKQDLVDGRDCICLFMLFCDVLVKNNWSLFGIIDLIVVMTFVI